MIATRSVISEPLDRQKATHLSRVGAYAAFRNPWLFLGHSDISFRLPRRASHRLRSHIRSPAPTTNIRATVTAMESDGIPCDELPSVGFGLYRRLMRGLIRSVLNSATMDKRSIFVKPTTAWQPRSRKMMHRSVEPLGLSNRLSPPRTARQAGETTGEARFRRDNIYHVAATVKLNLHSGRRQIFDENRAWRAVPASCVPLGF